MSQISFEELQMKNIQLQPNKRTVQRFNDALGQVHVAHKVPALRPGLEAEQRRLATDGLEQPDHPNNGMADLKLVIMVIA